MALWVGSPWIFVSVWFGMSAWTDSRVMIMVGVVVCDATLFL
jgi:hypothetical protein